MIYEIEVTDPEKIKHLEEFLDDNNIPYEKSRG